MTDILPGALAALAGIGLGLIFFGGLWFTVRKGVASDQPALWFMASLLLRMSVVLTGFYFISGGRWERLLACLMGFGLARLIVTWLTLPLDERGPVPQRGARHAP